MIRIAVTTGGGLSAWSGMARSPGELLADPPPAYRRMRILRILPLLALLAACEDTSGPSARAVITAQVKAEVPPAQPNVDVTVQNRGSRTLVVFSCRDRLAVTIDRFENGAWVNYSAGICLFDSTVGPVMLEAGESTTSPVHVGAPGRYRVQVSAWYRDDPDQTRTLVSNPFDVQ